MLTTDEVRAVHRQVVESYLPGITSIDQALAPAAREPVNMHQPLRWSMLQSYFDTLGPLPDYCLSLGTCSDRLPLMIDLADTR